MNSVVPSAEEWQATCTSAFLSSIAQPNTPETRTLWLAERNRLDKLGKTQKANRQVVIGAWDQETFIDVTRGKDLSGYDLRYCYFARVDFTSCNLKGAHFERCIFKRCQINDCDISNASFLGAHADEQTSFKRNKGLRHADLRFATSPARLTNFDPSVVRWLTARESISSFRAFNQDPIASVANWLTDYGRGVLRLGAMSAAVIVAFAAIYGFLFRHEFEVRGNGLSMVVPFLIMSAQRFINAPPMFDSHDTLVQLTFTFEGALGLSFLGLLVATLVNKLVKT